MKYILRRLIRRLLLNTFQYFIAITPYLNKFFVKKSFSYITIPDINKRDYKINGFENIYNYYPTLKGLSGHTLPNIEGTIERFILYLKNAYLFTANAFVLYDNKVLYEVSKYKECKFRDHDYNYLINGKLFIKKKYYPGSIAVINTPYAYRNYFHFIVDTGARYSLLKQNNIKYDWCYISNSLPFHNEIIEHLGIDKSKIIDPKLHDAVYGDELIIPSLPYLYSKGDIKAQDLPRNLDSSSWHFLRETLSSRIKNNTLHQAKNIYITRKYASERKIINEPEVITYLEKKYSITILNLEEHSILEQILLFSNAEYIISPHGAGLTNILFCNSKAKILEIFSESYMPQHYRIMAKNLDISYNYTCFSSVSQKHDFIINIQTLEKVINAFLHK